uniref:DUF4139 domain-containing protein n=1 Tax=Sphingomonas bacterium TaxID=1895847 RepID=UPI00261A8C46|nr:hypothetical protein [Sphingomonas bacterium]
MVTSDHVDSVSVTLYRDPTRAGGGIDPNWPAGYALITETRTIAIPAGRAVLRFEGVAQGMLPESAIIVGLPHGVVEKNRDARLLSPAALVDTYLKRRVTIRRTDRKTGKVSAGEAIIEAGPDGGVLLTTADGVEALGCSGLPNSLSYPGVPADLAARPTLSVVTDSPAAMTVTVRLSYLAQGFDWAANYVVQVAPDGRTLDLFAWMTIANGGSEGFGGAHTQAVAGALHREDAADLPEGTAPDLHLQCWPMDITSTHDKWSVARLPLPASGRPDIRGEAYDIVVIANRRVEAFAGVPTAIATISSAMIARQEDLGDLKLYRIPEPVTVAARSRKQVAIIDRHAVPFETFHIGMFDDRGSGSQPTGLILRIQNRLADHLGLPLPAGGVAVFEPRGGVSLLVGESALADRAVGEEVEFGAGASSDVRYQITRLPVEKRKQAYRITVTNARTMPANFEMALPGRKVSSATVLIEHKGRKTWRVLVPSNCQTTIDVTIED